MRGPELLGGVRDLALQEFGLMARTVFRMWGVNSTADFGEIVFNLIDAGLMSKTSQVVLCSRAMYSRSTRKARSIALTIARNRGDPCRPLRQCPRVRRNLEPAYAL